MTWQTTTDLLPHQTKPVEKMMPTRVGALFMDMGTGKTRCAIEIVARRQERISRVIIYCPVSLKETWLMEIIKHTDCPETAVCVFDDKTTARTLPRAFWYIIGIESMSMSDRIALAAYRLTTTGTAVIVDESDKIKGHNALRTRRITRYSEKARYRLVLTGTPMSQGVQDLYAQMRFLSPKILGYNSFYSFAANHLEYSEKYPGLVVQAHNTAWLAAKMQPYVYQITKEEAGLNLPAKLFDRRYFRLTAEQLDAYETAKWEILMNADEVDSYVIFQLFGALQQIVSGFWNRDGRLLEFPHRRLQTLCEVEGAIPSGEKIIIWSKYHYSIRQIVAALSSIHCPDAVAEFHGANEQTRNREVERWRREARFLVATPGCGGRGNTWNDAAHAIFYENEFKYAHRLQAEDRCHRIGQMRRPIYIDIVGNCKIEERIMKSHSKKCDVIADFRRKVDSLKKLKGKDLKAEVANLL